MNLTKQEMFEETIRYQAYRLLKSGVTEEKIHLIFKRAVRSAIEQAK